MNARNRLNLILTVILFATAVARGQTLAHRYRFASNQNATDIFGANGTAVGGATFTTNGVVLDGISGYVSLPPGLVSNVTAVTLETWATFGTIANNTYIFSFGNTDGSGLGANYIFCTPHGGGTRATISGADPGYTGEQQAAVSSTLDNQTNVMVTTVFNPPANFIGLYLNGVLVASNTNVTTTFASVNNTLSYLGKSLYNSDPYLKGILAEMRIYNGVLTNGQIAVDAAAGPGRIVPSAGALQSVAVGVTNMMVNGTQLPAVTGNFVNVTNVNLFGYGQPVVVSANTNIATVSAAGVITSVTPGTVTITASFGGFTNSTLLTIGFTPSSFTFDAFSDGFWTVTNALNGLPLTVSAGGASQETYTNGATDQQFELLYNYQNGTFRIRQHSSWLCLGAANGGTNITMVNYSAAASQQWYLVAASNGLYRIVNAVASYALRTDNGNPANVTLAAWSGSGELWGFSYQTHYPKKGCAGYEGDYAQLGLNWAYNYDDNTGVSLPASVNFAPMVDTKYWEPISDLQSRDSGWLTQAQPAYLLGYNEPDNPNTASTNPSTNDAIAAWPSLMALNIPLVAPAMQNEQDSWETSFYSMIAANGYRVDYSAVHLYVPPTASSVISDLQSEYNAYGRPVWLTEFSPVDWSGNQGWTEDDDYNFLAEFMWLAEGNEWLKRYAVFPFSGSNPNPPYTSVTAGYRGNFFQSDGVTLTPYGELYSTWDGITHLQTRTPYLIHNPGTSFRLTSTNTAGAPQPATIYTRDASAQWALLQSPTANQYYIISLKDGRRLRNNGGTPDLAPFGTTGTAVQWWMNGPDSKGYYYIDNLSASQSIRATGTAPAISFNMINDPAPSPATQWRLVKPYNPVTIVTSTPPRVAISYTSQSATLTWSGNGLYYNVYRGTTSGGPYTNIVNLTTNNAWLDSTVQSGHAYYYVVTALNILGDESAYSSEVAALGGAMPVTLVHRYSFSETSGTSCADSVGGAAWTGTLPNGGSFGGGQLTLSSNSQQYVQLPAGILSNYSAVTIEAWATFPDQLPANCFFFGFGNTGGGLGQNYIFCAPQAGRIAITSGTYTGEQNAYGNFDFSFHANFHVTAVFNPPAGYVALYTNGVLAGINSSVIVPLISVNDVFSYLGKSLYSADPYPDLSLDEFRIYNGVLDTNQIAATQALGANQLLSTNSPVMSAALSGGGLTLSWPAASVDYTVMTTTNLGAGPWTPASVTPQIVVGQWQVFLPVSGNSQYYRLQH